VKSIPILLVGGHLGAGKTTLINHLLSGVPGYPIAAIVNDFGDIDIDAALLSSVSETIISLKNGCICCSLQGDLLAALSLVTRQNPSPKAIVIETSGVSNPAEIARALLDPVIFRVAALDTIVTLVDLRRLLDAPELTGDSLWRTQLLAADFLLLTKMDLVPASDRDRLRSLVRAQKPESRIFEALHGVVPIDVLFGREADLSRDIHCGPLELPQFETTSWISSSPLSFERFQRIISRLAANTLRIKGLLTFVETPGQTMLFQCVGQRATLVRSSTPLARNLTAQLVFIGRQGELDAMEIDRTVGTMEL
jgi:cobalamin biosynthesis protein CobW